MVCTEKQKKWKIKKVRSSYYDCTLYEYESSILNCSFLRNIYPRMRPQEFTLVLQTFIVCMYGCIHIHK